MTDMQQEFWLRYIDGLVTTTGEYTSETAETARECVRQGVGPAGWPQPDNPAAGEEYRARVRRRVAFDIAIELKSGRMTKVAPGCYIRTAPCFSATSPSRAIRSGPILRQTQVSRRSHRSNAPPACDADSEPPEGEFASAVRVARDALRDGSLRSVELFERLREAGFSRRTAERAIGPKGLRLRSDRDGYGGPVIRSLPEAGEIMLHDRVHGFLVATPNCLGETLLAQMVRHIARVQQTRRALRERQAVAA